MSSVNTLSSDASSYLTDIIQSRRDRQDDRIEDGVKSGALSGQNKETLLKLQEKNDDLVDQALEDGTISRTEYKKLMKALDEQNKLIDKFTKAKTASKTAAKNAAPMENQEQILSILYGRMDRIEKNIDAGVEAGKIDADEEKKLEASLAKARETLDKAMDDGTISKGELSDLSKAQNLLSRDVTTYSRNRRYSSSTSRYSSDSAMKVTA